ncbi:MAG: histidinol-phosphate transaminase [Rhodothermia bacterium]|nr:MAG: histidinol-phosphate transaminase [Rhodothermia bacterium]
MSERPMEQLVQLIRSEIRKEKPYLIGGSDERRCKLNQNECPFDLPHEIKSELLKRFEQIQFNRYPAPQPFELMSVLEQHHRLPEGSVLVGNGSNDLTQTLALCFVSSGTRVVLPRPMFALYESVIRMHSGKVVPIPPLKSLHFDVDRIVETASDASVALTIVASPNNPTGLSVPFEAIERLCKNAPGFVVVDEAYHEFCLNQSSISLLDQYSNLIVMRTLSKAFGLAGIRIGYLLGHPQVMAEILKARLPFMVDRFSETTAIELVKKPDLIAKRVRLLKQGIFDLARELNTIPSVSVLPSTANFVVFKTEMESGNLASKLGHTGVVVRTLSSYPELDGYLRVSTGTESENKAFITALKFALSETT